MTGFLLDGDTAYPLALRKAAGEGFCLPDGTSIALRQSVDGQVICVGGTQTPLELLRHGDDIWMHINGRTLHFRWRAAVNHFAEEAVADTPDVAVAPMPGAVVTVAVAVGESVSPGQTMVVIESMKLETAIKAPRAGLVETVHVTLGETFDRGAALVTLAKAGA